MGDGRAHNSSYGGDPSRARAVFERVLALEGSERTRLLDDLRSTDPATADEVESLLKYHEVGSGVLDASLSMAASRLELRAVAPVPSRIGPFTILREIGRGGMGIVYEGTQDFPKRRAAIKVVRTEMVTASLLRRFIHEAEALAMLRHPGIAQLYEAGFLDERSRTGPYIAMELVEGVPLSTYASEQRPGVRASLELLAAVADAVDHAHKRGVIHRDLKPGNVLIDGHGQPKVLDFGIARLTVQDQPGATVATSAGQIIGTLGYMAPEQFEGDPHLIDARCDVYALGVMLYELLTGVPPVDVRTMSLAAASVAVREREPRRVSLLRPELRGDVEAIVAKAIEKNPRERYQSAAELSADIRRCLHDEPVMAHPQTAWYQARKFARRNRGLVALGAAGLAALLVGVAGTTWQAVRATRARERADVQSIISKQRAEFLAEVIRAATPQVAAGRETTVREMLDTASRRLLDAPTMDPRVAADTHQLLAEAYSSLGDAVKTEPHARAALELHVKMLGAGSEASIKDARLLGAAIHRRKRHEEALAILRPALEAARKGLGTGNPETLSILHVTAAVLTDRRETAEEAQSLYHEAMAISDELYGSADPRRLAPQLGLAFASLSLRDMSEAERQSGEVRTKRIELLGAEHPDTLAAEHLYVITLHIQGKWEQYDEIAPQALDRAMRVLGSRHAVTLALARAYADRLRTTNRFEESLPLSRMVLIDNEERLGKDHLNTIISRFSTVACLLHLGRADEAREYLNTQQQIVDRLYKPSDYMAALTHSQQVSLAMLDNDPQRAELWASKVRGTPHEGLLTDAVTVHEKSGK